jgi:hypothetical protein
MSAKFLMELARKSVRAGSFVQKAGSPDEDFSMLLNHHGILV